MSKRVVSVEFVDPGAAPDIDSDFPPSARDLVLDYVRGKYGVDNVGSLITPGPFRVKNAWKSMCSVNGVAPFEADSISKFLPENLGKESLADLLDESNSLGADFRLALTSDLLADTAAEASKLYGRMRETGVHPCGVIISSRPLLDTIPMQVRETDGLSVTQWDYHVCEELGLIKMDFLGLDTLDVIQNTVAWVERNTGERVDLRAIIHGGLDDERVLSMFRAGETFGVFQFSEDGVRDLLRRVKPTEFSELAAITALYRPGPMGLGLHSDYADRKNDESKRVPVHESFYGTELEEILRDDFGAVVYQESVIKIARRCAGFSARDADDLRKAIAKKKLDVLSGYRERFCSGMVDNGYDRAGVDVLWNGLVSFAEYAFNKSHAVSYALTSYVAAFLKVYYPAEFMASTIQQRFQDKKFSQYVFEARRLGITVEPPSVNSSNVLATPYRKGGGLFISYGLSCVKGVNDLVIEAIIAERERNGLYRDLPDFISRNSGVVSYSLLKQLTSAGCFDCFGVSRKRVFEDAKEILRMVKARDSFSSKTSLFDLVSGDAGSLGELDWSGDDWSVLERAKFEALATGLYLSGNPVDCVTGKRYGFDDVPDGEGVFVTFIKVEMRKGKGDNKYIQAIVDSGNDQRSVKINGEPVRAISLGMAFSRAKSKLASSVEGFGELSRQERSRLVRDKAYELLKLDEKGRLRYDGLKPIGKIELFTVYKLVFGVGKNGRRFVKSIVKPEISPFGRVYEYYKSTRLTSEQADRLFVEPECGGEVHDIKVMCSDGVVLKKHGVHVPQDVFAKKLIFKV